MYPMNLAVVVLVEEHQHLIVGIISGQSHVKVSCIAMHVACTGHVTHEKSAVAVRVVCTYHVPHGKGAVVVGSIIACSFPLGNHL